MRASGPTLPSKLGGPIGGFCIFLFSATLRLYGALRTGLEESAQTMQFEIEQRDRTLLFDRDGRVVWTDSRPRRLTERQSILLQMFCTMPDRCVSRSDYAQALSGQDWDPRQRLPLDQHVLGLRRSGIEIVSKRGIGYALAGRVKRLDAAPAGLEWRPTPARPMPTVDAPAYFWLDDRGHWIPAFPDHESCASRMLGFTDIGVVTYLLRRPGFVQLYLGAGWMRAAFDDSAVAQPAIGALYDFLATQLGYRKLCIETPQRGALEFASTVAALAWLDETQGLSRRIAVGTVIEEPMDLARCRVPEVSELVDAWRASERSTFLAAMQRQIRGARGHRRADLPVSRVLCVSQDVDGEPIYTEVGPGILMYGASSAMYLRGRRVRDQAARGYAQRAAEHYRRTLARDEPTLARIRSTVRLEHGIQTVTHLRLSLPASASGGGKRAVVARTVNV